MNLIEKFVGLSIRRGSDLKSLGRNPENLDTVLTTFRSVSENPLKPTIREAELFLSSAGDWISATPHELVEAVLRLPHKVRLKLDVEQLCDAVSRRREEIRQEKRNRALSREEEVRLSRIDRSKDQVFMTEALLEARAAQLEGEVPVGAVVVDPDGNIIGRGHNRVINDKDPSGHAEIIAMKRAAAKLGNYRLEGCTLYVTLEPCPMCSGAIIGARIKRLVYGAKDEKAGAVESVFKLFDEKKVNHHTDVTSGVLEDSSIKLLRDFFGRLRKIREK